MTEGRGRGAAPEPPLRPDQELEDEAKSLLRDLGAPPALPAAVRARAMRRLALAVTMGPQAAPSPGGSTLDAPGPSPADAPSLAGRLISARVPAWSLLASFAAGGALGLSVAMGPRAAPSSVPAKPAPVTMVP